MTEFYSRDVQIDDLLTQVDEGTLGLPQFQRNFIWKPSQVIDLLRSVAKRWPTGSFLLLEGPQHFAAKPIEHAPPLVRRPELLVLDGQQRMTALYHAIRDQSAEVYYIVVDALINGKDDEEYFRYAKREVFAAQYPTARSLAADRLLPISTVYDDGRFYEWLRFTPSELQQAAIRAREEALSGLRRRVYRMPVVYLARDIELTALAKIFETLNRTGVRLDAFDLMTAALYPHDFNLRTHWASARTNHAEVLARYNVAGIEVLKLIALLEHLRSLEAGKRSIVTGVRQGDVLAVRPKVVIELWDTAVLRYVEALSFLRDQCGVIAPTLLPSSAMVLTVAAALDAGAASSLAFVRRLRAWFWASCFRQQYSQGANTQVVRDAKQLRAWFQGLGDRPEILERDWLRRDDLFDLRRRNEILTRAVQCLLIARGARDILNGALLRSTAAPEIVLERIYQSSYMPRPKRDQLDVVLNFMALPADSARQLRRSRNAQAIHEGGLLYPSTGVRPGALETHCVGASITRYDWRRFLDARVSCIAAQLEAERAATFSGDE